MKIVIEELNLMKVEVGRGGKGWHWPSRSGDVVAARLNVDSRWDAAAAAEWIHAQVAQAQCILSDRELCLDAACVFSLGA